MQTTRSLSSSVSTPRSHKRGLSLTSKSRCQSSHKGKTSKISIDTGLSNQNQSLIFKNDHSFYNISPTLQSTNYRNFVRYDENQVFIPQEMPKVNFRYTNRMEKIANTQRNNRFVIQPSHKQSQQCLFRQKTPSVNSKSHIKAMESSANKSIRMESSQSKDSRASSYRKASIEKQQPNSSRYLIDSRRVQRQYIIQDHTQQSLFKQLDEKKLNFDCEEQNNISKSITTQKIQSNKKRASRINHQQSNLSKNSKGSPYNLLVSSTKKNENQIFNNSGQKSLNKCSILPLNSLQQIPQVQQFTIIVNEIKSQAQMQKERAVLAQKNLYIPIQTKSKQVINAQKKTKSPYKHALESNSQNQPPICAKSNGRTRSIKAIEKRLSEIISICDQNL